MNNSHGHVLLLHLQFHEGVRTFREVASVRHIMRSISVSCSRQRFKAGMVDLRVGRKAGGTGAPDLAMSLLAGPLVNNLMTSSWSSAMDQWWQLLICLGFQKEYQHGGVLLEDVGRCWKKEVSCTDLTNVIWGLQSDHFHSNQRARFLMDSCEKHAQKIAELLWPPHFCKQTPPWILNLEISSESEVLLE